METIILNQVEKEKFITVIRENQNLIFKICCTYCTNAENRKDLQQNILLQLWKSFPKFDGRVRVSTWIYRVALNTAISYYKQDRRQNEKETKWDGFIISIAKDESDSEQDEKIAMLYTFIEDLDYLEKALMLLYLDDNKYKDIATILGISETNVATKISRIKRELKEKFSKLNLQNHGTR